MIEVKRFITAVTPAILMVGLVLLGLSDTDTSIADTSLPKHEAVTTVGKANASSVSATLTIAMYAVADE